MLNGTERNLDGYIQAEAVSANILTRSVLYRLQCIGYRNLTLAEDTFRAEKN